MKTLLQSFLCFFACVQLAHAQAPAPVVFAINEGVSYAGANTGVRTKYADIAADLEKIVGRSVVVEPVDNYDQLASGLKSGRFDLAMVHPAQVASEAVRNFGYRAVSSSAAHTQNRAYFLSMSGSPVTDENALWLQYLGDSKRMKGLPIGAPDESSTTAWIARATIRDAATRAGANASAAPKMKYSRFQDSIPNMLEMGFSEVVVTASPNIVNEWRKKGRPVIFESRAVPVKAMIVSSKLESVAPSIKSYFEGLRDSKSGKERLSAMGLPAGFVSLDSSTLVEIDRWLRGK